MFPGLGTAVNVVLILLGSLVGLKGREYIPPNLIRGMLHAEALFTILLGINLVLENKPQTLKVFFILLVGTSVGYLFRLEERLEGLMPEGKDFVRAFVASSALFGIGPMTLLGCILEGAKGDSTLLILKALMDGLSSIILSSTLGKGVMLSAGFILIYQGSITFLAYFFGEFLEPQSIKNAMFIGGGILFFIGLQLAGISREIKLLNVFPALIIALFV